MLGLCINQEQGFHNLGTRDFAHYSLITRTQLLEQVMGTVLQ